MTLRILGSFFKYQLHNSLRKRFIYTSFCFYKKKQVLPGNDSFVDEVLQSDREFQDVVDEYFCTGRGHNCLVVQPYVKWGPQKKIDISPEEQLEEAVALVKSLHSWSIEETLTVPLDTLEKKVLFKPGSFEKIKNILHNKINISAIFVNLSSLKRIQAQTLQEEFGVVILDRYRIVMQILKSYASSKHAKLQVALAELHFMQRIMTNEKIFPTNDPESIRLMIHEREKKIKNAIKQLRLQRNLMRAKRRQNEYPIIAVVGYTNAGKTSLVKALTGEEKLKPKDRLFATLDVTMHQGVLPCGLKILYVDTVGFISDIPTNLIECFIATLEDAINADVILHIEDISSSCFEFKRKHVLATLENLAKQSGAENIIDKIISVGNKCDLAEKIPEGMLLVSCKTSEGLEDLTYLLQDAIIKVTGRKVITIKILSGGDEVRWLRKHATLVSEEPDEQNSQFIKAKVVITDVNLQKFKSLFV